MLSSPTGSQHADACAQSPDAEKISLEKFSYLECGERILLIEHDHDTLKILDPYGSFLFCQMREGASPETLAAQISETTGRNRADVFEEILAFRQSLIAQGENPNQRDLHVPVNDFEVPHIGAQGLTFTVTVPNLQLHIDYEDPELTAMLREFLPNFATGEGFSTCHIDIVLENRAEGNEALYYIVRDGKAFDTAYGKLDLMLKLLLLIRITIAESEPLLFSAHAAGLIHRGIGVLLPAKGGSGKTTLTAYLMHRGYQLVNDDTVAITASGQQMLPAPMCLSIKSGSRRVLTPQFPDLQNRPEYEFGDRQICYLHPQAHQIATEPAACRLMVIPNFDAKNADTSIEAVTALDLFEHLFYSGCTLERPMDINKIENILNWLATTRLVRLSYSDLDSAANAIDALIDGLSDEQTTG